MDWSSGKWVPGPNVFFVVCCNFLLTLLLLFSRCAVLTNTPGLRDSVIMRVLSDFYWTAATGAGLFTSNSATQQRHAEHCVQAARALCWERVSLTGIPVGNQSDLIIWACVVRTCIQWKHVLCCWFASCHPGLSRCSISCRKLMWWAPWDLPILVTGLRGVCPTIFVKNLGEVIQNYHL